MMILASLSLVFIFLLLISQSLRVTVIEGRYERERENILRLQSLSSSVGPLLLLKEEKLKSLSLNVSKESLYLMAYSFYFIDQGSLRLYMAKSGDVLYVIAMRNEARCIARFRRDKNSIQFDGFL